MSLFDRFKQFQAEQMNKPVELSNKILFVDGLNTYIRAFAATPTLNDDATHVGGITGFLLSLGATIRQFAPTRVVIIFDGAGGSQRRRKLFPEYKASRRNMTRLNRTYDFNSLEEEKEAMKWQLKVLAEILRCLPVTIMAPDLIEADDAIAYLARLSVEKNNSVIISSTDKDFIQLVSQKISVWNPIQKRLYNPEKVVEHYSFHPTNFLLYRAITGDKSDCIPGVSGIKEKTLLKFFPSLATGEEKTLDDLYEIANADVSGAKKKSVTLQSFLDSKELIERNIQLMRLDEGMAVGSSSKLDLIDKFDAPINEYNKTQLTKTLLGYKLMNAISNYETWLQATFVPLLRYKLEK